jgi:hypothetical protein
MYLGPERHQTCRLGPWLLKRIKTGSWEVGTRGWELEHVVWAGKHGWGSKHVDGGWQMGKIGQIT